MKCIDFSLCKYFSGSKNLNSTYRDTALNNSTTSISVLKSKVEQKVDNKLKNVINSKEHQYVEYIKTLNKSVLDQHKIKEDNKNPSSPITYTNSKFYGIIIGLCVVFLLFELIVMITIVNVMRWSIRYTCCEEILLFWKLFTNWNKRKLTSFLTYSIFHFVSYIITKSRCSIGPTIQKQKKLHINYGIVLFSLSTLMSQHAWLIEGIISYG